MEARFLGKGGITHSVTQGVSNDELSPQVDRGGGGNDHLVFTAKKEESFAILNGNPYYSTPSLSFSAHFCAKLRLHFLTLSLCPQVADRQEGRTV